MYNRYAPIIYLLYVYTYHHTYIYIYIVPDSHLEPRKHIGISTWEDLILPMYALIWEVLSAKVSTSLLDSLPSRAHRMFSLDSLSSRVCLTNTEALSRNIFVLCSQGAVVKVKYEFGNCKCQSPNYLLDYRL